MNLVFVSPVWKSQWISAMIVANTHRTIGGLIAIKGATVSQRIIDPLTRSRVLNNPSSVETSRDLVQGETKKRRVSDVVVGIALILLGSFGSLLLYRSASQTIPVVGVSRSFDRGHVITKGDLEAIYVAPNSAKLFIAGSDAGLLIGQSLSVAVKQGTPLTQSMLNEIFPLTNEEALTAAAVDIGNIPANLSASDIVRLVLTPDATIANASPPVLFDEPVSIWAIERTDELSDSVIVTFRGPLRLSLAIASAGNIRISLVND